MQKKKILALFLALCTVISLFSVFFAAGAAAEEEENIALGKPVTVSRDPRLAKMINDGNPNTSWTSNWIPLYAEVDLTANYTLDKVVVKLPMKNSDVLLYEYAFNVYGSTDGVNYDRIGEMTTTRKATDDGFIFRIERTSPYRFVRVMSTMSTRGSSSSTAISELEVYGTPVDLPVTEVRDSIDFPSYDEWLKTNCGVDTESIKDENGKYRISDTYTRDDTVEALEGLVKRVLGADYLNWFVFEVTDPLENGNDYYEISDDAGKIRVKGNEGVSIAAGLNHYLKYFCLVNVSQETARVNMPDAVVPVGETIHTETSLPVRYTYNYCTLSYTMPYYGYADWQRELDYLMLSGINVVLDTTATEALWVLYLQKLGYTLEDARAFVCGYTWKAWWLMGNLESYGGPVSDQWIVDTVEMARVNQRYLTVMGADPCLQTFTGTMPTNFAAKAGPTLKELGFSDVSKKIAPTGSWAGFTRPYALNTDYDGFDYLAKTFYETQDYIYGRIGDYYAGDFLHEISGGFQLDPQFDKAKMSRTVLDKLLEENDRGVWIIQSWWENPLPEVVEGWGDDREDHMLLLDLAAVQSPRWVNRKNYGGYEFGGSSWCYCILEDYGGRDGVHLDLNDLQKKFANALKRAEHLKGIGLTAEGTERNPVVFDLFWELAWYPNLNAKEWIKQYGVRRTGSEQAAEVYRALMDSVYGKNSVDGTTVNYSIGNYPKFDYTGGYFYPNYDRTSFDNALLAFIELCDECKDNETYVYDAVELFTTELANTATKLLEGAFASAKAGNYENFHVYKTKYLHAMQLVDELNAFHKNQTLGNWVGRVDDFVNDPRTGTYSDFDVDLMKLDAVILITNWSTIDLGNYAYRLYNGLMDSYYYVMWSKFMQAAESTVRSGGKITAGDDRLTATIQYCYNVGRQVALDVMFGKQYQRTSTPVDGDFAHRSLKEVLTEIAEDYFFTSEHKANTAALLSDSALTLDDGVVSGTLTSLTAAELSAQFEATGGAKVGVLDGTKLLSSSDAPAAGMKLVLVEEDGAIYDGLGLTVGTLTAGTPTDAQKALAEKAAALCGSWSRVYKKNADDIVRSSLEAYTKILEDALDAPAALSALKDGIDAAEAALSDLIAENKDAYVADMPYDAAGLIGFAAAAIDRVAE